MEETKVTKTCTCEGTVRTFDTEKGHGFIEQADLSVSRDVILGEGDGPQNLFVGEHVRYEVEQGATAPHAVNVRRI